MAVRVAADLGPMQIQLGEKTVLPADFLRIGSNAVPFTNIPDTWPYSRALIALNCRWRITEIRRPSVFSISLDR